MFKARSSALRVALLVFAMLLSLVATSPVATADAPPTCAPDAVKPGQDFRPPGNTPIGQGAYFSYPNRSNTERMAIRDRVLNTINATWGRYWTPVKDPDPLCPTRISDWQEHHGTIRLATWSMNDWGVRDALVKASQRFAQVQIIAAQGVNALNDYKPWKSLKSYLNQPSVRTRDNTGAWECSGACRGSGGTPHSKYFLFHDVGGTDPLAAHIDKINVQTSMNLTAFAYGGQWNSAVAMRDRPTVYDRYAQIFEQARLKEAHGWQGQEGYGDAPDVRDWFYPGGSVSVSRDPVLLMLNRVRCTNAGSAGISGRTRVRAIQYALFDTRGVAIAKKLRALWNSGCNVQVIYSVTSRPVLKILRAGSGRGPVPMRQSVIKNSRGEIVKYNHSKWLAIGGNYAGQSNVSTVLSGSANWSNFAYGCDEQMMQTFGNYWAAGFFRTFDTTWRQPSSKKPTYGGSASGARLGARQSAPTFGYGIYKYMETD